MRIQVSRTGRIEFWQLTQGFSASRSTTGSTSFAILHHGRRHRLEVIGQPGVSKKVYEGCRIVIFVSSQFRRLVIPWEDVVVVVPTLTERNYCHKLILARLYCPDNGNDCGTSSGELNWVIKNLLCALTWEELPSSRLKIRAWTVQCLVSTHLSYGFIPHIWAALLTNQVKWSVMT